MQIIGIVLILIVIALYVWWITYTKNQHGAEAKDEGGVQVFDILVKGVYSPAVISAKVGLPVKINFRREESSACSKYVNFSHLSANGKMLNIREELPENKTIAIEFTPDKKGEYSFTCDMSMYQGKLVVE